MHPVGKKHAEKRQLGEVFNDRGIMRQLEEMKHSRPDKKPRDEEENRSRKHAAIGQVGKKERGEKGEGKDEEGSHAASSRRARDKVA